MVEMQFAACGLRFAVFRGLRFAVHLYNVVLIEQAQVDGGGGEAGKQLQRYINKDGV